ncbi:hypothetical protein O164_00280 [Pseudomonas taiwanensis SJ9]|uniref:Uncharacterized protein n=1 Tax=Pseudomonas taiwanensis SJ9 TaxID=1388762 RepID=V7DGP8_9PSED|nr:hypothetical protein O164_00280 [Pseudomonas taiwanensis SJ9]
MCGLACRIAYSVIDIMEKGQVPQHAAGLGRHILQELRTQLVDIIVPRSGPKPRRPTTC